MLLGRDVMFSYPQYLDFAYNDKTSETCQFLLGMLAGEAWTMQEWNMERASLRIAEEAKKREVGTLVLGLPKNMDGSEGPRAEKSREFKALLERDCGLPVILWDERRSSIEAHNILHAAGKKERVHRKTVDAVAASLILEGYLGRK